MPRVSLVDVERDDADLQRLVTRIREERGSVLMLYKVLLNSVPIAEGWLGFLTAIRQKSSLPARLRELVILRIAALNSAPYEFAAHAPFARDAGIPDNWIASLREGSIPALTNDLDRAVLMYTDKMTRDVVVSDSEYGEIGRQLSDRHVVELTATIAAYNMVSRFLTALSIHEEH